MTPILKVITEYCAMYVDDVQLQDLSAENPPLYARRMWQYLQPAISLFTLPMEMQAYLVGTEHNPNLIAPTFAATQYTTDTEYDSTFTISLGDQYSGYELYSCRQKITQPNNNVYYAPVNSTYDSETGTISIIVPNGESVPANTTYDFDFYTDGYFVNNLSGVVLNILGMCFQVVWQDRFNTDWLSMVSKVEDRSFSEQNRANKIKADTERLEFLRRKLAGEMRKYEQSKFYEKLVPPQYRINL